MFDINALLTDPGADCNEDRVGHAWDTVWVIDGATGVGDRLTNTPSDAAWLAETASTAFAALMENDPDLDLRELVRGCINHCRKAFEQVRLGPPQPGETLPSAAILVARARKGAVDIVSLGDCGVVFAPDGEAVMIGPGQSPKENETIAHANAFLADTPGIGDKELVERLGPKLKSDRARMNCLGGYWIFSLEPQAADHMRRMVLPIAHGQPIALASDGFLRLIDLFGCDTPHSLLAADEYHKAAMLLHKLRKLERMPESRERFPRIKRHDDASFIHATYRGSA